MNLTFLGYSYRTRNTRIPRTSLRLVRIIPAVLAVIRLACAQVQPVRFQ